VRRLPVLIAALALLAPAPALASSATFDENGILRVDAGPGEVNVILARPGGQGVIVSDSAGIQAPGPPFDGVCSQTSPTEITCAGDSLIVAAGDGDDSVTVAPGLRGTRIVGGAGNDRLQAGVVAEIHGDDGNDTIVGSDVVLPGPEPRDLADTLVGGPGNDDLAGGDGADSVTGSAGDDTVAGGAGNDSVESFEEDAAAGNDVLRGGDGADALTANEGRDRAYGEAGSDFLHLRAELNDKSRPQRGDCGPGKDKVNLGSKDRIAGCEQILLRGACDAPCRDRAIVERIARGRRKKVLTRRRSIRDDTLDLLKLSRSLLRKKKLKVFIHSESRAGIYGPDGTLVITLARRI
jgi:Ca2+-binding RTX toxin-like protein